jgi:hypothetical protein
MALVTLRNQSPDQSCQVEHDSLLGGGPFMNPGPGVPGKGA